MKMDAVPALEAIGGILLQMGVYSFRTGMYRWKPGCIVGMYRWDVSLGCIVGDSFGGQAYLTCSITKHILTHW